MEYFNSPPRVVIIVLNWNNPTDTLECLESIKKIDYPDFTAIVVDNGSTDDSVVQIRSGFPEFEVIETGRNLGYAGGNNIGIRQAIDQSAQYVLVLNNDTALDPGILSVFVSTARELDNSGLFAAKIYYYDQPKVLWNAGSVWDPELGRDRTLGSMQEDSEEFSSLREIDHVNGCALFAPTEVLKKIGLFDEAMFLIYEDADLSCRAREQGYKCYFVPEAKVFHKISLSIGGSNSPLARYFNARNQLRWAHKHKGLADRLRVYRHVLKRLRRAFVPPLAMHNTKLSQPQSYAWATASWLRELRRNLRSSANKAELMGIRDFLLSRFGDCPKSIRQMANKP